jgi:transposase-like protein
MPKSHRPYTPEFRQRIVAGETTANLSKDSSS